MTRLVRYLTPYSIPFVIMVVLLIGQTLANLALPDYLATIVNLGIVGQNTRVVYDTGKTMLLVALLGGACMVGVGYRATVEPTATTVEPEYPGQQFVNLKVGYSHPVELGIPKGVKASTPQPTRLLLEGIEREAVMQFAAKIRMWRKPEPYKGKGIFVNGETIKLKNKKIK